MSTDSARRRWTVERGLAVRCPYCASEHTERSAAFGAFHMSESYMCLDCHGPFSRIKWRPEEPETGAGRAE